MELTLCRTRPPAPPFHNLAPLRVLVVDGDADAADSLVLLLRLWGFEARAAYSGPAALDQAPIFHPDVVLTELLLPGRDGVALALALRGQAVLVAVTTQGQTTDRHRAYAAGFAQVFVKPADPTSLHEVLLAVSREGRQAS